MSTDEERGSPSPPLLESGTRVREVASKEQLRFAALCTALVCLSSILGGYDAGVMSGALVFMKRDFGFSREKIELIAASLSYCAAVGALIAGSMAARFGRRHTIAFAALLFFGGSVLMAFAQGFLVIFMGRILLGVATGTGLLIAPLYSAELSPESMRGRLVSFTEVSINIGISLGYVCSFAFKGMADDFGWRYMVALGGAPAILLFTAVSVMPESPRWLIQKHRVNDARAVLSQFMAPSEMEHSVRKITESIKLEEETVKINWFKLVCGKADKCSDSCLGLWRCDEKPRSRRLDEDSSLGNDALRKALFIGVAMAFFQMITGIEAITYYSWPVIKGVTNGWPGIKRLANGWPVI